MAPRAKPEQAPDPAALAALAERIAVLEARQARSDRILAQVAAKTAPVPWDDFRKLLVNVIGVSHADAEAFIAGLHRGG
jgi:hypothetical protein